MVTVALVLVGLLCAVAAGEFVRGQCRRMLSRPAYSTSPADAQTFSSASSFASPSFASPSFAGQEPAGEVASAA